MLFPGTVQLTQSYVALSILGGHNGELDSQPLDPWQDITLDCSLILNNTSGVEWCIIATGSGLLWVIKKRTGIIKNVKKRRKGPDHNLQFPTIANQLSMGSPH